MLAYWITDPLWLSIAQAGVTFLLAMVVILIARQAGVRLVDEALIALIRGVIQIVIVGSVLSIVFRGALWTSAVVLFGMLLAASSIAARRAVGIPSAFQVSLLAIGAGAGSVILILALLGILDAEISTLVPVGSMILSNTMNASALMTERFRSEMADHRGFIEAGLALGAAPETVSEPYVQAAVRASLIPQINALSSLGIVWIPGLMSGMILSGANPLTAAITQFVTLAAILAAGAITALVSALLLRRRFFTPAEQLVLPPRPKRP